MAREFEQTPNVIDKGIQPEGGGLILVGESGIGKSLILTEWAVCLMMGWEIMGFNVPKARRVYVFQAENPLQQVQFRLKRIIKGLGITNPPDHLFFSDPKAQYDVGNIKTLAAMIAMIKDKGADVFMIDPLSSFHQADENKNDVMRRMLDNVTYISRETGAASTIVHHFGKPVQDRGTAYRYRGATAIKDWCDTMISITAKPHEHKTLRNIIFNKIRHGPEQKPILLERDENFIHSIVEDDVLCPPGRVREILESLGGYADGQNELKEAIMKESKCGGRSAVKFIHIAVERGAIQEVSHGAGKKKGYYAQNQ
jgi:RecA-family ATPase